MWHELTQIDSEHQTHALQQRHPSMVRSIADAVVIKNLDVFFLCHQDGEVPLGGKHGLGLYYHDCRFLCGYELRIAGMTLTPLVVVISEGSGARLQLTNEELRTEGGTPVAKQDLGVEWQRTIAAEKQVLLDVLAFRNFGTEEIHLPISLAFEAHFDDIFQVRGVLSGSTGNCRSPQWRDDTLVFAFEGSDRLYRSVAVHIEPAPASKRETSAELQVALKPGERKEVRVAVALAESSEHDEVQPERHPRLDLREVSESAHMATAEWPKELTEVRSSSRLLDRVLGASFRDLRMLLSQIRDQQFFAAGVPWFVTLFGRDSLISALQMLAFEPAIAEHTLRLLASFQGREVNSWKDEEPGKMPHEYRRGELARMGEVPYTPYYGTVDATPLFLVLLGRHAAWTGRLDVFRDLRENVERALGWIDRYGDQNGDGYLEYEGKSAKGLANHGWKDSGDAIVNEDGSLAEPPISLVEVQGYAYLAKRTVADLFERDCDADRARQLREDAGTLHDRFNRDFWLGDKGHYALALQAGDRPCVVLSSNVGQALWTGIATPEKARLTMERLMTEEMFSGWGIRTLSEREVRYNPVGYHLGTVWPHDNSLIAAGFRNYGFDEAARHILAGIVDAGSYFGHDRLPEVFAGFSREEYHVPVQYPVACHPQAWAAGSVPYLLATVLGLQPEAFDRRLRIVRPDLADFVDHLELRHLRVGEAYVDLRFTRAHHGGIAVEILNQEGPLEVVVELKP